MPTARRLVFLAPLGGGPAYDPCSIYVTELDGDRILRVAIGSRGAELKL